MEDDQLVEKALPEVEKTQESTKLIYSNEFVAIKTCISGSTLEREVFKGKRSQETFSLAPKPVNVRKFFVTTETKN